MSQQAAYPMAQSPKEPIGNYPPNLESTVGSVEVDNLSQGSYGVAQLPVHSSETYQAPHGGNLFPKSQSMPLPAHSDLSAESPQSLISANGELRAGAAAKIEYLRNWSISTYKCTKQLISEKLGKSTRTVDTEIETQIDALRDVQRKYLNILRLARSLSSHFQHVVITQVGVPS